MASSSGCAINKQIRLLYNRGKEFANGEDVVDDMVQKMKIAARTNARAIHFWGDMVEFGKCPCKLIEQSTGTLWMSMCFSPVN